MANYQRSVIPKDRSETYDIAFGSELGMVFSKAQSVAIKMGNDLQRTILKSAQPLPVGRPLLGDTSMSEFLNGNIQSHGIWVCTGKFIKAKSTLDGNFDESDLWVFVSDDAGRVCYIVELKLGGSLDTKKCSGESDSMTNIISTIGAQIGWKVKPRFCSFTRTTKQSVVDGYKNRIPIQYAMTGKELCSLIGMQYDAVMKDVSGNPASNLANVSVDLYCIPEVRKQFESMKAIDDAHDNAARPSGHQPQSNHKERTQ